MKRLLGTFALVTGLMLAVIGAVEVGQEAAVPLVEDIRLQREIAGDPRYMLMRQIEAAHPGIYVVDIELGSAGEGEDEVHAIGIYLTFDRRITSELDAAHRDDLGKTELDLFIQEVYQDVIEGAAAQGYDIIGVGLMYVHRIDVLGGRAWQGSTIQFVLGYTEDMVHWARIDGCDRTAMREYAQERKLRVWLANPYQPMYHTEYLQRPLSEQPMLWDVLEQEGE